MPLQDHLGLLTCNVAETIWWWKASTVTHYVYTPVLPETVELWQRVADGDLLAMVRLVQLSQSADGTPIEAMKHEADLWLSSYAKRLRTRSLSSTQIAWLAGLVLQSRHRTVKSALSALDKD